MGNRDILAIGASAGGFDALRFLASQFASDLPASILITIHLSARFPSRLDELLTQVGPLKATFASGGETLAKGHIYIAPPGRHLLIEAGRLVTGKGPRENHSRPAIDPMLRSVGVCCAERAIGVVLTGTLSDGAAGLAELKQCGGLTVIQDPDDAAFRDMPEAALKRLKPDHVVALRALPALLAELVRQPAGERSPPPAHLKLEVEIAKNADGTMTELDQIGSRSVLTCPDCGGLMWEINKGGLLRYRCHVGHAYTAEPMDAAADEHLQVAMGTVLRAFKERVALTAQLQRDAAAGGRNAVAQVWGRKAQELEEQSAVLNSAVEEAERIAARYAEP